MTYTLYMYVYKQGKSHSPGWFLCDSPQNLSSGQSLTPQSFVKKKGKMMMTPHWFSTAAACRDNTVGQSEPCQKLQRKAMK